MVVLAEQLHRRLPSAGEVVGSKIHDHKVRCLFGFFAKGAFCLVENIFVFLRHSGSRCAFSPIVVVSCNASPRVAYENAVSVEIPGGDGGVCEIAVFCFRFERVVLDRVFCAISAGVGISDELNKAEIDIRGNANGKIVLFDLAIKMTVLIKKKR